MQQTLNSRAGAAFHRTQQRSYIGIAKKKKRTLYTRYAKKKKKQERRRRRFAFVCARDVAFCAHTVCRKEILCPGNNGVGAEFFKVADGLIAV